MPRKKGTDKHAEIEAPEPAQTPAEELIVVEYQGDDEETLYAQLDEAREKLADDGQIYLTVPKDALPADQVTRFITLNFRSQQPLNVATNPRLTDNDQRRLNGWICVK